MVRTGDTSADLHITKAVVVGVEDSFCLMSNSTEESSTFENLTYFDEVRCVPIIINTSGIETGSCAFVP